MFLPSPRPAFQIPLALATACIAFASDPGSGRGAACEWVTYEAEEMSTSGAVLGPAYDTHLVETESSGRRCVKLSGPGAYLEFTAREEANALVIRFSAPDSPDGAGAASVLALRIDGRHAQDLALTSHYSRLYGDYPFVNDPTKGHERYHYDEQRVRNLTIPRGATVRLELSAAGERECIVDLVDLEQVPPPRARPENSLSLADYGATGRGDTDDTEVLRRCLAVATAQGKTVWVPSGTYKLTGDIDLESNAGIQGAGMWHTTFVGDETLYPDPARRVRFRMKGARVRLADFAIVGKLKYRNDSEPNDGIIGAGCSDTVVERIWVEHTKAGAWIYNGRNLSILGCRFRNLLADGVNLCVGTTDTLVENCSARGTGDDCFAIWPSPADQGFVQAHARPGNNTFRRCTAQLPFLANGFAIYGGASNRIEDCLATDIPTACGVLISTTFPIANEDRTIDNGFSGITIVKDTTLVRCGGFDDVWGWRGALQLCLDHHGISGIEVSNIHIADSISHGITLVAPGSARGDGRFANIRFSDVTIGRVGLGIPDAHKFWIRHDAEGSIRVTNAHRSEVRNDSAGLVITD